VKRPSDVIRTLDWEELPDSVRELKDSDIDLSDGLLMPHQKEWVQQCIDFPLNIAEKCRRSGITLATAWNDTITAASNKDAGGDNIYYIGDTQSKGLEFIGYCAKFALALGSAMAKNWDGIELYLFEDQYLDDRGQLVTRKINAYRIRFSSGYQIVALSSNPVNIRGLQGIVNIDEAAHHLNVAAVISAALALIIWGGRIRIIGTHNGYANAFNLLIKDSLEGLNNFKLFTITFDQVVANGLYEKICLVKGWTPSPEGKKEWYEGVRGAYGSDKDTMKEELDTIPQEGNGIAIPGILVENCMHEERPIVRLELEDEFALNSIAYRKSWCEEWIEQNIKPLVDKLNPNLEHSFGMDYARHGDFSSFTPLAKQKNLVRKVPFVVEMQNVPVEQQQQILWYLIKHLPKFTKGAMDATGNGETIAELTAGEFGHSRIEQVKLNDAWYRPNMLKFKKAIEDQVMDLPKDTDVSNDIRSLRLIDGVIKLPKLRTKDTKNKKFKRHGDTAIALALGYFASCSDIAPIEWTPIPDKNSRWDLSDNDTDDDDFRFEQEGAW